MAASTNGEAHPAGTLRARLVRPDDIPPDPERIDDGDVWATARLDASGLRVTVLASVTYGDGQTATGTVTVDAAEAADLESTLTEIAGRYAGRALARARRDAGTAYALQQTARREEDDDGR